MQNTIQLPMFISDMVSAPARAIDAKRILSDVFNVFFQSDDFCGQSFDERANYVLLLEDLHRILDLGFENAQSAQNETFVTLLNHLND